MSITLVTTNCKQKNIINSNNLKKTNNKYDYFQKIYNSLYKISKYDNLN